MGGFVGIVLLVLGSSLASAAAPANDQRPLDTHALAVEAYRAGDWESAETLWRDVLRATEGDDDFDRASVLYDIGNCAFRRGNVLAAVGWYTAAARRAPRDGDVRANLEFARTEAGLDPADRGDLEATFARLVTALTVAEAEWLVLVALFGLAIAFVYEALYGGPFGRRAVTVALVVLALTLVPWIAALRAAAGDPYLVVADSGAPVRSEPRDDATVLSTAGAGEILERTDAFPGWIEVELDEGRSGWVPEPALFALRR